MSKENKLIMTLQTLANLLSKIRAKRPLIHHITNALTVNDCANVTLSIGAAPVMAEAPEEAGEMVSMADALVLNIGTLSHQQVISMLNAGYAANARGIPVILDPVGAGATKMRTESARLLLDKIQIAVLKGNIGEIGVLAGVEGKVRGVDSWGLNGDPIKIGQEYAQQTGVTVAVSGAADIVTDGNRVVLVGNGHPMMSRLTGTGCMVASLVGAFAAVCSDRVTSSVAAFAAFGIAGERAAQKTSGPYSFRTALMDEIAALQPEDLMQNASVRSP